MLRKQGLVFLFFIALLFSGCSFSASNIRSTPKSASEFQSVMDRFERTNGLSWSEIPELYDTSRLKAGSSVKVKLMYDKSKKPYFETQTIREIKLANMGKRYIIDMVMEDNHSYTLEGGPSDFNRVIWSDNISITDHSKTVQDNIPTTIIKGALFGGPIGIAMSLHQRSSMQALDEELKQSLKDRKSETKIIDFKLISNEILVVSNKSIPCRVYQIQTINRNIRPVMKHAPGSTYIIEESKRVWISDEVPFGLVKSETDKILNIAISGKHSMYMTQNMTESCEVTEFNY